ncbi:lysylphosphatidylglycerol synthase domain-containing protein [Salinisphaera hydrothermalis]|uniref:lysylphosphatidylglycerol synthase domain-containing protein n=1 Tax=Salinisphaera hydrothermalis TaxID=563188 RepID=UPI0033423187
MSRLAYAVALVGGLFLIALIAHTGYRAVLGALAAGGWSLLWLVPYHLVPIGLDAVGWRVLIARRDDDGRAGLGALTWIALVREGVSRLLPVASVGGEIAGIRLLILRGVDGAAATASVVIEVLVSLLSQYLFTAVGVALLIILTQSSETTTEVLIGIALTCPAPIIVLLLLDNARIFQRLERFAERTLGGRNRLTQLLSGGATLDQEIEALIARRWRLVRATLWQFAGMVSGSFEVWLALHLLGHPVSVETAVILESVTLTIRNLAFLVPGGLGVQEAGLMVFGQMLGLSNDAALALSLIKRGREIVMGIPILLSWQIYEARHLRRGNKDKRAHDH